MVMMKMPVRPRPEMPEVLYHYTGVDGLLGMMDGELWATQIHYMNDGKEYDHAFEIARKLLKQLPCRFPNDEKIKLIAYHLGGNINRGGKSRQFIFSLTEQPDLLSQWRGYCPDGGYSVGFNADDLELAIQGFKIEQCLYDDAEKDRIVTEIIDRYVKNYYDLELTDEVRVKLIHESIAEFRSLTTYFKHSSFAEEKEWRLVGLVPAGDKREAYRAKDNLPIPYAKSTFNFYSLVTRITVSPRLNYELAAHAIMFKSYFHKSDINIQKSNSSLV